MGGGLVDNYYIIILLSFPNMGPALQLQLVDKMNYFAYSVYSYHSGNNKFSALLNIPSHSPGQLTTVYCLSNGETISLLEVDIIPVLKQLTVKAKM